MFDPKHESNFDSYDLRTLAFQRSEPRHEFGNSDVRSHHRRVWRVPVVLHQQLNKFYRSRRCVSKIALELMQRCRAVCGTQPRSRVNA